MSNKDHDYKGVYFTLGPIYFHQFNSFIKHGVGNEIISIHKNKTRFNKKFKLKLIM